MGLGVGGLALPGDLQVGPGEQATRESSGGAGQDREEPLAEARGSHWLKRR